AEFGPAFRLLRRPVRAQGNRGDDPQGAGRGVCCGMKRVVAFLLLLLAVPAVAAVAQNPSPLFELYAQGRYDEAARAGETAHTAYGYAVAARAVLADAVLRETPCLECLQRAAKLARAAVA